MRLTKPPAGPRPRIRGRDRDDRQRDSGSSDGANDFTNRRGRRPLVQRPVEPDGTRPGGGRRLHHRTSRPPGFLPGRDAIIEIGAIRVETKDGRTRETVFSELVKPSGNIPKKVRELTGITNETVRNAVGIDRVLPRAAEFIGDAALVAHSAHFDRRFLEHNARLMGRTFAANEWICTPGDGPARGDGTSAQAVIPDRTASKGSRHPDTGALDDCRATLTVWRTLKKRLKGNIHLAPLDTGDEMRPAEVAYDADLDGQVFLFSGFRDEVLAARIGNAGGRIAPGYRRR